MTMHASTKSLLTVVLAFFSTRIQAQSICHLCGSPEFPKRWDFRIEDGRSCRDVYLELGNMRLNDSRCAPTKAIAQDACCGDAEPEGFFAPVAPPTYTGPVGDEPDCPICISLEYPGIPSAFIVARYVGEFTCDQLYSRGLNGMTPDFMCGPLQDFALPICGCGAFNPRCKADPSQCYGQPGSPPVAAPAQAPRPAPVASPVAQPAPTFVAPTIYNRKTPPEGGKYGTKLSNGRGGAASVLRGGRREEELPEDFEELPQVLEFDFHVVDKDQSDESH